jgi:hypothetical protein
LDYLANELIFSFSHGHTVEGRSTLSAHVTKRMTVAALLLLKNESPLTL